MQTHQKDRRVRSVRRVTFTRMHPVFSTIPFRGSWIASAARSLCRAEGGVSEDVGGAGERGGDGGRGGEVDGDDCEVGSVGEGEGGEDGEDGEVGYCGCGWVGGIGLGLLVEVGWYIHFLFIAMP